MKRVVLLLVVMVTAVLLATGVALATTVANNNGITINDATFDQTTGEIVLGEATPYPSEIEVSDLSTSIQDVNLTLKGYSHTYTEDVGVLLVGPKGQKALVMSDVGGADSTTREVNAIELTLDDEATGSLPDHAGITPDTYKPTQGTNGDGEGDPLPADFPSPAPEGPYDTKLDVFDGTDPNGIWQLYVLDDTGGDNGSISGWSLDISASTQADTTPPTVTATTPRDTSPQSTHSKTAPVTATFSEPVQNVSTQTFILERKIAVKKAPPKFERVDATVTPSLDGISAVLDPVQDLPKGEYRATITTEVTDQADPANALDQNSAQAGTQPKVWTFKVEK